MAYFCQLRVGILTHTPQPYCPSTKPFARPYKPADTPQHPPPASDIKAGGLFPPTIEPDRTLSGSEGPPPAAQAGTEAALFVVDVLALILARRLEKAGVRLVMLVLVVGPIVAVVLP